MMKWIGALLIFVGCSGAGIALAAAHRREEAALEELIRILDYIQCELQYRMPPLPSLCHEIANYEQGMLGTVLEELALQLENQLAPDATVCMNATLSKHKRLPEYTFCCLRMLGESLGRFDLTGQIQGVELVRNHAEMKLKELRHNREPRLRGYQTLGVCAGAALIVLFI